MSGCTGTSVVIKGGQARKGQRLLERPTALDVVTRSSRFVILSIWQLYFEVAVIHHPAPLALFGEDIAMQFRQLRVVTRTGARTPNS